MNNSKITAVVTRQLTQSGKVDHYTVCSRIATYNANPAAEIRRYYALLAKVRAKDAFGQAALDAVDWDSLVTLFRQEVAA